MSNVIIDKIKFEICLAKKKQTIKGISSGLSSSTIAKIRREENVSPRTIGKLAAALGVEPEEIIKPAVS